MGRCGTAGSVALTRRVPGIVKSVYDGDTMRCDLRLGWGVVIANEPVRLYGVDTPELRGDERVAGRAAREWVRYWLLEHCDRMVGEPEVIVESLRWEGTKGKYGRSIARIWDTTGDRCLNDDLIRVGHAVAVDYS